MRVLLGTGSLVEVENHNDVDKVEPVKLGGSLGWRNQRARIESKMLKELLKQTEV